MTAAPLKPEQRGKMTTTEYWIWQDGDGGGSVAHFHHREDAMRDALASLEKEGKEFRFVVLWDDELKSEIEEYQVWPASAE